MSKRAASYDIDEHTYEEKEKLREAGDSIDDEGQHLTNRKYFKYHPGSTKSESRTAPNPEQAVAT